MSTQIIEIELLEEGLINALLARVFGQCHCSNCIVAQMVKRALGWQKALAGYNRVLGTLSKETGPTNMELGYTHDVRRLVTLFDRQQYVELEQLVGQKFKFRVPLL